MKNPRKVLANPNAIGFGIGDFYVELTTHLFGGTVLPKATAHLADIDHPRWDTLLEVKGGGDSNGIKAFGPQVEDYLEELGRKREHCLYALYRYTSDKRRPGGPIAKDTKIVRTLYRELAERTRELHVVDVRLLNALGVRNGTRRDRRDSHAVKTLILRQYMLQELAENIQLFTHIVGFRHGHYKVIRTDLSTVFNGFPMSFPVTFVVPRELRPRIETRLRKLAARTAARTARLAREPELSFDQ